MPYCTTNGIKMHYEVKGHGDPLILVTGITADITTWPLYFLETLADKFQVIIFDNRGAGKTDTPEEPYTMDQFSDDVFGLLNHLNLESAHFYGESMGGMIVQNFALKYPKVVKSIIIAVSTVGRGGHRLTEEALNLLSNHRKGDYKKDLWKLLEFIYTPEFITSHQLELTNFVENPPDYPIQSPIGYRNQLLATYNHATKDRLHEINCPTLVLVGMKDRLILPENSLLIHELIPHSKLIKYPNAAHMYRFEEPSAVNDIIEFLESIG